MEYSDYPVHAWSRSRHQMRRICPRKAVLCYREARLGADIGSDKCHRLLHDLRRRIPLEQYLNRIFDETVRRIFYTSAAPFNTVEQLEAMLISRFDRDLEQMLCGSAANDHKKLFLKELEHKHCHISNLVDLAGKTIRLRCEAIKKTLWQLLTSTPPLQHRETASPLQVQINDLCCYCSPLFALENNGCFWMIECNCDDFTALLHKFYAVNVLGREPHLVRSFGYRRESGEFYEAGTTMNVSQLLSRISEDGAIWQELIATPLENIPANTEHCHFCEYNFFCNKYLPNNIIKEAWI